MFSDKFPGGWGSPQMHQMGGGISNWGDSTWTPNILDDPTFQGSDNFSWNHGKHSLRLGGLLRRDRYNLLGERYANGFFAFSGYTASNPNAIVSNLWTGWGTYMLGVPNLAAGAVNPGFGQLRATSAGLYIDDSWHVSPTVTVSLGLRWEYQQPWWDKSGHAANITLPYLAPNVEIGNVANMALHPTLVRTGSGGFYDGTGLNYPGVQVARDGRLGRALYGNDPKDFAPRLGVSWSPSDKWAIRLGAGIFYSFPVANQVWALTNNTSGSFNIPNSNTLPTYTWTSYLTNGATLQLPSPALWTTDYNLKTPITYAWMLNVQRRLSASTMLQATYSGSVARHLYYTYDPNQPLAGTSSIPSRTPFPEYGLIVSVQDADRSSYEAGAVRIQRRAHGITFTGSLTWARSMDYGSEINLTQAQNSRCLQCNEYGPSGYDVKFRVPLSFVYDLPFGKGEKFANTGGVVNQIVGGWQLSVVYTLQTGSPMPTLISSDQANNGAVTAIHPNATGLSAVMANPTPNEYFNTAAFSMPAFGSFGDVARDTVRGPGKNKGDTTLARNFKIREGHTLQFRYEVYNFLNHPNWGVPNYFMNQAAFGRVTNTSASMRQMQFSLKYKF